MIKIVLAVLGVISFVTGLAMTFTNYEPFSTILLWYIIGVLCIGFIGVIEAIEKHGEK